MQYTKDDLRNQFGWTFQQVKTRLRYLEPLISNHYQGSKGVQYRFDNRSLAILRRLHELEGQGHDIKAAARQIIAEVENPEEESKAPNTEGDRGEVKALRGEVEHLRSEINYKNQEIDRLHNKIDRLLPGETRGPFQRFFDWLDL